MSDPIKASPKSPAVYKAELTFKYPSEDECMVRRLGSGVLAAWGGLAPEVQARILAEAIGAWDREYGVPQLRKKLESFIRGHRARFA